MQLLQQRIRARYADAADLVVRPVAVGRFRLTAYFLDGLTSSAEIARFLLEPLQRAKPTGTERELYQSCLEQTISSAVCVACRDADDACRKLGAGFCVLIFPGMDAAIACEVKTGVKRGPEPPEVENTVKGAKDAFTETLRINTGLVRSHLRTPELQLRERTVGRRSGTVLCVLSIRGLTNPELTDAVVRRVEQIDVDGLLFPAAAEEYLTGSRRTAFPLLQYTERADRFCQGLLHGQVGVLADGLPLGYLLPVNIGVLMTAAEDQGTDYLTASGLRMIRYAALLIALLLPALYVAMAQFYPAMIPIKLLRAIIASKEQVPFFTVAEVLGLLVSFELLQEAGLHLPQSIGQSVSIIGGLVVGTAAVEARMISPAALIVVSAAGICGFALPGQDLSSAVRVWRFFLTVCAAIAGLFGLTLAGICLAVHLGTLTSLGVPYLSPFSDVSAGGVLLRRRMVEQKRRPWFFRPQDTRNQR